VITNINFTNFRENRYGIVDITTVHEQEGHRFEPGKGQNAFCGRTDPHCCKSTGKNACPKNTLGQGETGISKCHKKLLTTIYLFTEI